MLHASGKFVPSILDRLAPEMPEADQEFLRQFQSFVVASQGDTDAVEAAESATAMLPKLKELASAKKKAKEEDWRNTAVIMILCYFFGKDLDT